MRSFSRHNRFLNMSSNRSRIYIINTKSIPNINMRMSISRAGALLDLSVLLSDRSTKYRTWQFHVTRITLNRFFNISAILEWYPGCGKFVWTPGYRLWLSMLLLVMVFDWDLMVRDTFQWLPIRIFIFVFDFDAM